VRDGVRDGDRWLGDAESPAEVELRKALDEARLRVPDDVTLRRMWAQVSDAAETVARETGEAPDGSERAVRRRRAPRWIWFASGMVSTAAMTAAVAVWLWPRTATSPGPVATISTKQRPATRTDGSMVVAPGRVRTGEGETLHLTLRGGTQAVLGSSSVMALDADDKPTVERGRIAFDVPRQPFGRTYVVHSGPYRVIVVGTRFQMRVDGAESFRRVTVSVDDGVVEVWDRARLARLQRGESWTSPETALDTEGGTPTAPAEPSPSSRASGWGPHAWHARRAQHARTVAMATPGTGLPPAGVATPPAVVTPPAPEPAPAVAPAPAVDNAAQARAALASGDPQRALALYKAIAQKGGAAGENAEYEMGKVLRDRLGQPAGAVAAWRRYRAEHPEGILRVETDVSIIETLVDTGDSEGAISEATDFVRRHPDSERRAEMARLAGDLLRTHGDCRRAVAAYQSALSAPHAASAAEAATFHRASCLVQLGDAAGADAARDYLRTWPAGRFHAEAAKLVTAAAARESEGAPRP